MNQGKKSKVKVLYQNLGGVWYAFTNVGKEVYFSPVNIKQSAQNLPKLSRPNKKREKGVS